MKEFQLLLKISNWLVSKIISKINTKIKTLEIQNPQFTAILEEFTENTYILLVVKNPKILPSSIILNIGCAKNFFKKSVNDINNLTKSYD